MPQTTNTTKENCQYCHLHIDFLPDSDRSIFKWHLDGHGEKESLPQTTKEQVIQKFVKELSDKVLYFASDGQYEKDSPEEKVYLDGVKTAVGMMNIDLLGTPKSEGMLSSTYDTAYENGKNDIKVSEVYAYEAGIKEGIRLAMESIIYRIWESRTADDGDTLYVKFSKDSLRQALSELLNK